ncbi:MAG: multicopper oxidase domain-containing protein [Deltaproteobacteria bacterium]|nr:multicopper oxidase domain-containing protein [Deltaproteobacteria bacterium]
MPWVLGDPAYAAKPVRRNTIDFTITDALKDMVTHNSLNTAQCYFWVYKEASFAADCPAPLIFATSGDTMFFNITNALTEPHALFIPGPPGQPPMFDSGPIAPGQTISRKVKVGPAGSYLYYDNLNAPVNRMMGLHGALVVMPRKAAPGQRFTPYDNPTPAVQRLFNELGTAHWPGLAWEQGDPNHATFAPPFRQYIWVLHQPSSHLFAEVGQFAQQNPGQLFPAQSFIDALHNEAFVPAGTWGGSRKSDYFTINGQSGHFAHNNPYLCPNLRVGEPCVIRVLNAGMQMHSIHIHCNHQYVLSYEGQQRDNLWWVDTASARPMGGFEWLNPYMRSPDVPNVLGIGRADLSPGLPTLATDGHLTWPPTEELNTFIPPVGTMAGGVDISVRLSPLCFPMHDHCEPSQTAQGGNYNCGMISGMNITGDRTLPGGVVTFPNEGHIGHGPMRTGLAAPEMKGPA